MIILGVETSASAASAAVIRDGLLLSEAFSNTGLTHSQTLMTLIDSALKTAQISVGEIDTYAVANGPGSFTGIRIGVAAVKGLAFAGEKKCIPVSTLEALAWNCACFHGIICPVMDARCRQVYTAFFEASGDNIPVRLTADRAMSISDLSEEVKKCKKSVIFVGDGAEMCYNFLLEAGAHPFIAPLHFRYQHASSVALCAKFRQKDAVSSELLLPTYLRLPQAERELRKRQGEKI